MHALARAEALPEARFHPALLLTALPLAGLALLWHRVQIIIGVALLLAVQTGVAAWFSNSTSSRFLHPFQ